MFLAFLIGPVFQIVGIGTQISEALAGLERTREVLRERPEDEDPRRQVRAGRIQGEVVSTTSPSPTTKARPCCTTSPSARRRIR
jgi:ABC-type bacteriocin/lantibiotic exporter with double-glycine peptidase domain